MSSSTPSPAFLAPGLLPSPKLRKTYSPVPKTPVAWSRQHSFDGSVDKSIKKSLVEEFYKKEAKSKQRSYTDIQGLLGQAGSRLSFFITPYNDSDSKDDGPVAADSDKPADKPAVNPPIDEKIVQGKLLYTWKDHHVGFRDGTAENLINLDRGVANLSLSHVDEALAQAIRASGRSQKLNVEQSVSEIELQQVEKYLRQETAKVDEFQLQLMQSMALAKGKYRTRLQGSMDKLHALRHSLEALAERVNAARERIVACKGVLLGPMKEKLAVLDDVCRLFEEYDRAHRQQRMWYLIITATCFAVALIAYTVMAR